MAARKKTTAKHASRKKATAAPAGRKKATKAKATPKARAKATPRAAPTKAKKATKAKTTKAAAPKPAKPVAPPPSEAEVLCEKIIQATTGDPDAIPFEDLYAENCVSIEPRAEPAHGLAGIDEKNEYWSSLQKRSTWKARRAATAGDTILIEWEAQVEMRDGRTIPFEEVAVHRVENGRIVEERYYYDPAVFEAPAVAEGEPAPPPAPRPRSSVRPVEATGTPPVDPLDL